MSIVGYLRSCQGTRRNFTLRLNKETIYICGTLIGQLLGLYMHKPFLCNMKQCMLSDCVKGELLVYFCGLLYSFKNIILKTYAYLYRLLL